MKKKIIFMLINMNVGGTEKALLNMISEMPKEKYDITIFMLEEYGEFLDFIPNEVNIEYLKDYKNIKDEINKPPILTSIKFLMQGKFLKALSVFFLHALTKILKDRSLYFKYLLNGYIVIDKGYDVAVAYAGPMDFISYFVVNKIKAKKKIQWIHFDVTKIGFNRKFANKIYSAFDKVFVVSDEAENKLTEMVPEIKEITEVFHNIVSSTMIDSESRKGTGFNDEFDGIRILTVGRLTREKGQDMAIHALSRLVNDGYKVRWYCVGEGNLRREYESLIEDLGLTDKLILLGTRLNPYPYIKNCDIYVQPSRYEGYCITLIEARCLNKPIVVTNVNGAKEQIVNGETGLIVEINEYEIYNAVKKLLNSIELSRDFSQKLASENYHTFEMNKLYKII